MGEGLAGWGAQRAARTAGPPAGGRKYNIAPSGRLQREFPLAGDLFAGLPRRIQTFRLGDGASGDREGLFNMAILVVDRLAELKQDGERTPVVVGRSREAGG